MRNIISDYTEAEFLAFVTKIYEVDFPTDQSHIDAIFEFERLCEHPNKSDLIFFPEPGKSGPASIVEEIKAWRKSNNRPGFKADQ